MINEAGVSTVSLKNQAAPNTLGLGAYGFFNKDTYVSVVAGSNEVLTAQPLVLASAAIPQNDKIGPFHGGYAESNKSKYDQSSIGTLPTFTSLTDAVPEQVYCGTLELLTSKLELLLALWYLNWRCSVPNRWYVH